MIEEHTKPAVRAGAESRHLLGEVIRAVHWLDDDSGSAQVVAPDLLNELCVMDAFHPDAAGACRQRPTLPPATEPEAVKERSAATATELAISSTGLPSFRKTPGCGLNSWWLPSMSRITTRCPGENDDTTPVTLDGRCVSRSSGVASIRGYCCAAASSPMTSADAQRWLLLMMIQRTQQWGSTQGLPRNHLSLVAWGRDLLSGQVTARRHGCTREVNHYFLRQDWPLLLAAGLAVGWA